MKRRALSPALAWTFFPYVTVSILHVALLAVDSPLAAPTTLLLMPLLAIPVAVSAWQLSARAPTLLLFTALLFSWLGDGAGTFLPAEPELP